MEMVFGPRFSSTGGLPAIVPLVLDVCLIAFSEEAALPGWSNSDFTVYEGSGQDMTRSKWLFKKLLDSLSFIVNTRSSVPKTVIAKQHLSPGKKVIKDDYR